MRIYTVEKDHEEFEQMTKKFKEEKFPYKYALIDTEDFDREGANLHVSLSILDAIEKNVRLSKAKKAMCIDDPLNLDVLFRIMQVASAGGVVCNDDIDEYFKVIKHLHHYEAAFYCVNEVDITPSYDLDLFVLNLKDKKGAEEEYGSLLYAFTEDQIGYKEFRERCNRNLKKR